jgi:hypothetical protein
MVGNPETDRLTVVASIFEWHVILQKNREARYI